MDSNLDSPDARARCPRCDAALDERSTCASCGRSFERWGGVLDAIGSRRRESAASGVEEFYTRHPFPGYGSCEDAAVLVDRSRAAPFLEALDRAVPPGARLVDLGAGTAQLAMFLALSSHGRRVLAVDGCRASLQCADEFARRENVRNLRLLRADLFDLPLEPNSFEFVISRGVVHHTPDPTLAISCVADLVAPGGVLLLGFYESVARGFHRLRRGLGRLVGREIAALDPVLRRADLEEDKKRVWIEDQYRHPLERCLALPRVLDTLEGLGFEFARTVPPLDPGDDLLRTTPRPRGLSLAVHRVHGFLEGVNDPDAGLIFVVARRANGSSTSRSPSRS